MAQSVNVLVLTQSPMPDALLERVRAASPRVQLESRTANRLEELEEHVWDTLEVLYTTGLVPSPERAPALRWIQGHFAGVEHVLQAQPALMQRVTLTTSSGIHAPNMGEYILMMLLAQAHHLPRMWQVQAAGQWPAERWKHFAPRELRGTTMGIVGYGSIGREVARLARAFGMRVLAAKRNPARRGDAGWRLPDTGDPAGELPERYYGLADLRQMLSECDDVVVTAPLTAETHHLIDAAALQAMRREAFLVNVSRGGLVDEAALVAALQAGTIAGAALDVFEHEPLPADSPLWKLPNVILSPHVSGFSLGYDERAMSLFAENLRRYLEGDALLNVVDAELGY